MEHRDEPSFQPAPPPAGAPTVMPLEFTGSGSEYFRIWIVNLALTILTLGIYSAWAKVRRLQYFHRNTRLAGASFDYHARPLAILKGRVVALVLFGLFAFTGELSPMLGLIAVAGIAAILPWLMQKGARFRAHNTSYRGLRFDFRGTVGDAYRVFALPFVLFAVPVMLTGEQYTDSWGWLGAVGFLLYFLLQPVFHARLKRYQQANLSFGQTRFGFRARIRDYVAVYLKGIALSGLPIAMIFFGAFMMAAWGESPERDPLRLIALVALMIVAYACLSAIAPFYVSRFQNLVWNNTDVAGFRFESRLRARQILKTWLVNMLLMSVTLGLYWPFAAVRMHRLRVQSVSMHGTGDVDAFLAHANAREAQATGAESAEVFDVDLSL